MRDIENIEGMILHGILFNEDYMQKVLPFIKEEYFQTDSNKTIFRSINEHIAKYNKRPMPEAIAINLDADSSISSNVYDSAVSSLHSLINDKDQKVDGDWLGDMTEKWCQDSAFYNVILEASDVIDGNKDNVSKHGMPEKMTEALSISFDTSIGHDYFDDAEARFDSWHEHENRLAFDLEMFNRITKDGLPNKTLSILMSTNTGGFKSGSMCSMAAANLMDNKNVLYITMELADKVVSERIDANLLRVDLDDLKLMSKQSYLKAVEKNQSKTKGKLVVKEYPTSSAHAGHFRFLLKELQSKHGFKPDIIYLDYLNICLSSRLPTSAISNSYLYIKTIAEEIRGLAVEFDLPIMSATQSGRDTAGANDVLISDISESYGLTFVADMLIGVITTPELDEMNQILFKQLKNRFGDINKWNTFPVGVNKAQMRLFDISNSNQKPSESVIQKEKPTGGYEIVTEDSSEPDEQTKTLGYNPGIRSKREKFKTFKM